MVAFLERCSEALGGVCFSPEAVGYLDRKVQGQAVMLQMICAAAAQDKVPATRVELADVLGAVCRCYEVESEVVDRVTNIMGLTPEALLTLSDVVRGSPSPCLEFEPATAELVDCGMIVPGPNHLAFCRSSLVRELLVGRYFARAELPGLTRGESFLVKVPSVHAMVVCERLFRDVEERKHAPLDGWAQPDQIGRVVGRDLPADPEV